jgi:HPt (histidine-containing phosphotransfer) domain-containing protein
MQDNNSQEAKIWDKELLLKRVLHNKEIYDAVLNAFIEDIPELSRRLMNEISNVNFLEIAAISHNIKGCAYNIAANSLGDTASNIETSAKEESIKEISKLFHLLEEQLSLLLSELTAER